jgi:DNA-binding MarR family transcriptional regulator
LEKQGLVRRYHPEGNKRTVYIEVTSLGLQKTVEKLKGIASLDEEIKSVLDDEEITELVNISRKLRLGLAKILSNERKKNI